MNRWYSIVGCWVSWVETVKRAGQQHETWEDRGLGSACPAAPNVMSLSPLTIKCIFTSERKKKQPHYRHIQVLKCSSQKLQPNLMLTPVWCLLVLLVRDKDQITTQECDWDSGRWQQSIKKHIWRQLHPNNSSAADIGSSVRHSQSHPCSCKPLMNRQHACCPTCTVKAGD